MNARGIWSEAVRNVGAGTTRAATFALLLALLIGMLAIGDVQQVHSIVLRAREFQAKGASISVLSSAQGIDPIACEALGRVPGIRAAGALRTEKASITASALPAGPIPSASITPGFARVLGVDVPTGEGVLVSEEVAKTLGVAPGGSFATNGGDLGVQGVFSYPSDGRRAGYGYSVLIPTRDHGAFDECWIDVWPSSDEVALLVHTSELPGRGASDSPPRVEQLNTSLGRTFDSQGFLHERLTRWFPFVGIGIGALLGYVSIRVRRLEIASNLHAGVARRDQRTMLGLETILWTFLGTIIASALIACAFVFYVREGDLELVLIAGRVLFPTVCAVLLGAWSAWLTIREKHLFVYFKNR